MRVNQNLHRALNINLDEEIAQTKSTSGHQPTSNLYYYIKVVRGSLPPPDSAFSQSTPSIYIHQIITVRLVTSASSLLHPSIVTAPLSAPLFLDRSSIKLHPRRRRQWLFGLPTPPSNLPPTLLPTPPPLPPPTLPAHLHGHLEVDLASPSRRPTKARNPLGEASAPPEQGRGGEHASALRLWVGFLLVRWRPPSRRGRGPPATSECSR
jgi:hypothetical protein